MSDESTKSARLYERAKKVLPGGVSRNTVLRKPHPAYVDHASGSRVVDIEGVERIDFANNFASLIHGHSHPAIVAAVTEQVKKGTAFSLASEVEVQLAEHLTGRNSSFEMVRFVNSGTEAVMTAVKAARAFTGRHKIAKVEGAYHGGYDYAETSQESSPENWGPEESPERVPTVAGTPDSVLADVVVVPFNAPERAVEILDRHRGEIACVLLDPMPHRVGLIPANPDFVSALRQWTAADGSLLLVDEVITFRSEVGGAQTWYDLRPDLTVLGKIIGGGFPVGAVTGRAEVMEVMNPLAGRVPFPQSGTFSANPVTMTAGLVAMELYDADAVEHVNSLAAKAMAGIREAIAALHLPASVTGRGSLFRLHLQSEAPGDYRSGYLTPERKRRLGALVDALFDDGLIVMNTATAAISTPMDDDDVTRLVEGVARGLERASGEI